MHGQLCHRIGEKIAGAELRPAIRHVGLEKRDITALCRCLKMRQRIAGVDGQQRNAAARHAEDDFLARAFDADDVFARRAVGVKDMPETETRGQNQLRGLEAGRHRIHARNGADIEIGEIDAALHTGGDQRLMHLVMRQIVARIIGKDFKNRTQMALRVDQVEGHCFVLWVRLFYCASSAPTCSERH